MSITIHFIDNQEIKIQDIINRDINSKEYKVITSSEIFIYPMSKISFVEVKEK